MGRLPFDPDKMRGASEPPPPARAGPPEGALSVSRLAAMIRAAVEERLPARLRVVGEVSGSRRTTHLYFSLKDSGAVIGAVIFASSLRKAGFEPRDGQEVLATGRVEYYEPQGRLTLIVERIEPIGEGAHELRFRQLCDELRALGWFDPARKRPLPSFPRRVAVVTSASGAALQDVRVTMERRCPAVGLALVPVRVQGDGAAAEVARALRFVSGEHRRLGIDAVIVTRGGGSPEDLAVFNEREIARAIVECAIPVVAAIGHETDTTIAELVADERCATPTQAAMRLTPDREALARQLDSLGKRLAMLAGNALRTRRQWLASASRHPVLADPAGALRHAERRLAHLRAELGSSASAAIQRPLRRLEGAALALERRHPGASLARARATHDADAGRLARALGRSRASAADSLAALSARLDCVSPASVLRRGYSCTRRADGSIVRDAGELVPGERLTTQLASGSFESDVVRTSDRSANLPAAPLPRVRPPKRPAPPRDQLDLFTRPE
ncbi:MAG TPA: exodeoxyribonuclease VII large subunit [Phycisphaerales bacterium]|nr:exodeoxyribonuclease VII large subunit [Phycisphaerales bacterium]